MLSQDSCLAVFTLHCLTLSQGTLRDLLRLSVNSLHFHSAFTAIDLVL